MNDYTYVFKFNNNFFNRFIVRRLKNALNNDSYRIRLRARHNDRKKILKERYCRNRENYIKIKDSQYFAVYIDDKRKERQQRQKQKEYMLKRAREEYENRNNRTTY